MSSVSEILDRHQAGISDADVAAELDAALSAAEDPGAASLSADEIAYLREHGGRSAGEVIDAWDPQQARRQQSQAVARRVADTIATSVTIAEAAERLRVDRSRISHRLKQGTLWGFTMASGRRLPRWQFTDTGLLPGLERLVASIPADVHPLSIDAFMRAPRAELDQQAPLLYLASGGDPRIVAELLADLGRW